MPIGLTSSSRLDEDNENHRSPTPERQQAEGGQGVTIKRLPIQDISMTRTQTRATINMEVVDEYAERMAEGDKFPPPDVFCQAGTCFLGAGFHRVLAALKVGWVEIEVNIHEGTVWDAILFGVGDNGTHGLRRSNEDKRRSVEMAIQAMKVKKENWSDREIARRCVVSEHTVAEVRAGAQTRTSANSEESNNRKGSDGKSYPASKPAIPKCRTCGAKLPKGDPHDRCDVCRLAASTTHSEDEGTTGAAREAPDPLPWADEGPKPVVSRIPPRKCPRCGYEFWQEEPNDA